MFGWKKGEDTIQGRVAGFQARRERPLVVDHRPPAPPVPPAAPEPLAAPLDAPAILAARDAAPPTPEPHTAESVRPLVQAAVDAVLTPDMVPQRTRADLALAIDEAARAALSEHGIALPVLPQRNLVTLLLNDLLRRAEPAKPLPKAPEDAARTTMVVANRASIDEAAPRIYPIVMQRIDTEVAMRLNREELARQLAGLVAEILTEERIQLNQLEQRDLVTVLLNDMLGLGPLEPLLADDGVTDIMVNGPKQVYVERRGKLELTGIAFRDNAHVMAVATRIVTTVGRRVDESSPLCDARLPDGSRVNIIIPPLAIDGPS
ncbi:MAG TPA: ATPase, T2SS/T4P/T4SS family, partial [Alphaproteobacteria bacterium]|nr:ATPase, T2SS/T4P/T4SS family [Alphaproteobacteria bacterium]